MNAPYYNDHFGKNPIIKSRGVIGASLVNVYALIQNVQWDVVFGSAHKLDISSSSNDDAWAGTGTMKIVIYGLDTDYHPLAEEITLTGQTVATTLGEFRRVFAAYATVNGIGTKNAGDIYILKAGTGGVYNAGVPPTLTSGCIKIIAGDNLGYSGVWTAPAGSQYRVIEYIPSSNKAASIQIVQGYPAANVNRGPYPVYKVDLGVGVSASRLPVKIFLDEKTDIYTQGIAIAATTIVSSYISLQKV